MSDAKETMLNKFASMVSIAKETNTYVVLTPHEGERLLDELTTGSDMAPAAPIQGILGT